MGVKLEQEYQELLDAIEKSDERLNLCLPVYIPQNSRHKANCLADMGNFFFKKNMFPEAMQYYAQARDILKDDSTVLNQIGVCLTNLGKLGRALWVFYLMERRADRESDKALAWYNICNCLTISQKWQEAVTAIKKSIKYDPNSKDSQHVLSQLKSFISTQAFMDFKQGLFVTNRLSAATKSKTIDTAAADLNSNTSLGYD